MSREKIDATRWSVFSVEKLRFVLEIAAIEIILWWKNLCGVTSLYFRYDYADCSDWNSYIPCIRIRRCQARLEVSSLVIQIEGSIVYTVSTTDHLPRSREYRKRCLEFTERKPPNFYIKGIRDSRTRNLSIWITSFLSSNVSRRILRLLRRIIQNKKNMFLSLTINKKNNFCLR